jgi:hypothetical protein
MELHGGLIGLVFRQQMAKTSQDLSNKEQDMYNYGSTFNPGSGVSFDESWKDNLKNSMANLPDMSSYTPAGVERNKAKDTWEKYEKETAAAQTKPKVLEDQWAGYKDAQTKTGADYTKTMEPYIGANVSRMEDQYGRITNAQGSLAGAMEAAQRAFEAERADATNFFNTETKTKYDAAMAKAAADYEAVKQQVQQKMDASDAYYNNSIKPQYAKLMEGGLSLRDASDPSNYVSQGVQNAYEGLIQKSQKEADTLAQQTKRGGQADYGVLAALGNQARGSVQAPMTGAQGQLAQQASLNQASQAYQNAMQRVSAIEDQQRLYAQQARETGLGAGMDQSWKNYDAYGRSTVAAQNADLANYNAQLQGTSQLGNLSSMAANTQFQGIGGLANARSALSGNIQNAITGGMNVASAGASGIGNLANTGMGISDYMFQQQGLLPGFAYQQASGFNEGDYGTGVQSEAIRSKNEQDLANIRLGAGQDTLSMERFDRMRQEDLQAMREAQDRQAAAAAAQQDALNRGNMLGSIFSTVGTVAGGVLGAYGGPAGAMAGATIGGGLGNAAANVASGGRGGQTQQINPYAFSQLQKQPAQTQIAPTSYQQQTPTLNPYWQQSTPQSIGISPTMQGVSLSDQGASLAQQQYGLKIDPSLYYSPYANYGLNQSPQFMR